MGNRESNPQNNAADAGIAIAAPVQTHDHNEAPPLSVVAAPPSSTIENVATVSATNENLEGGASSSSNNDIDMIAQSPAPAPTTNWMFEDTPVGGSDGLWFNQEFTMGSRTYILGSDPRGPVNAAETPEVERQQQQLQLHRKTAIHAECHLLKNTLRLVPVNGQPNTFVMEFNFDTKLPCTVAVYYVAKETPSFAIDFPTFATLKESKSIRRSFEPGMNLHYLQPDGEAVTLTDYTDDDLLWKPKAPRIPIVIVIQTYPPGYSMTSMEENAAKYGDGGDEMTYREIVPGMKRPQAHCTMCTFVKCGDNYTIKVMGQRLTADGVTYVLQDVYGIEANTTDDNDATRECVICMSNPRNVILLPCRHMCLCTECANTLRYKSPRCPICRQACLSLLDVRSESQTHIIDSEIRSPADIEIPKELPD